MIHYNGDDDYDDGDDNNDDDGLLNYSFKYYLSGSSFNHQSK